MSEIFEIWPYFLLHDSVFGMALKCRGKLFAIFGVNILLSFSVAITYMFRADIFLSLCWFFIGFSCRKFSAFVVAVIN